MSFHAAVVGLFLRVTVAFSKFVDPLLLGLVDLGLALLCGLRNLMKRRHHLGRRVQFLKPDGLHTHAEPVRSEGLAALPSAVSTARAELLALVGEQGGKGLPAATSRRAASVA